MRIYIRHYFKYIPGAVVVAVPPVLPPTAPPAPPSLDALMLSRNPVNLLMKILQSIQVITNFCLGSMLLHFFLITPQFIHTYVCTHLHTYVYIVSSISMHMHINCPLFFFNNVFSHFLTLFFTIFWARCVQCKSFHYLLCTLLFILIMVMLLLRDVCISLQNYRYYVHV